MGEILRAVRMVAEVRPQYPSQWAAITTVAGMLGGAGLRWGVEPMCAVLSEHGVPISPSTYYESITKTSTPRQIRGVKLVEIIAAAREDKRKGKLVRTLGSRKLWIWLPSQVHDVGRRRSLDVRGCVDRRLWQGSERIELRRQAVDFGTTAPMHRVAATGFRDLAICQRYL